ncbi:MAG: HAD-IA family hydrolase [Nitrospirota bacterium]|nr:HAD-IA family hydrolase [Nitrospirota bacterium]
MAKWRAEVLLFDFDGTLIDSKVDIATAVNLTLGDLGLPLRSEAEIFSFVGDGVKRLLRLSVGEANQDAFDRALEVFRGHYLQHCVKTTQWYSGIFEVLQHYKERKKVIVTNKSLEYTLCIVDGLQARDLFQHIEAPRDTTELKPEPVMLERALEVLGADPSQTVMIGDSTNDVRAAQAAGIRACAVGYGYGNREKVVALQPEFYCETPHDLLDLF